MPTGALLGMTKPGWAHGAPGDAGVQSSIELRCRPARPWPSISSRVSRSATCPSFPEQTITGVSIAPGTFADVDPVLATDTLSDLAQLSRHRR